MKSDMLSASRVIAVLPGSNAEAHRPMNTPAARMIGSTSAAVS